MCRGTSSLVPTMLQEYFVPTDRLDAFVAKMADVLI
jgi:hypothetical protein